MVDPQSPLTQPDGPLPPVDLTNCDREPVHAPAAIQPFGAVLVARRSDRRITHASDNLSHWIGLDARAAIGRDLAAVVGPERADEIGARAAGGGLEGNPFPVGPLPTGAPAGTVHLTAHTAGEHLIVTAEPAAGATGAADLALMKHAIERLRVSDGVPDLCARLAEEVRMLTGFDRVMVYRFHPDHSGEVVAEAARAGLPAYLGLNYPAADIPAPAREIYKKVWVRVIPDAAAPAVPLVPPGTGAGSVDLTHCPLRAVSPIHVEYLTNMGVTATMSLSLLSGTELWGLVACHHYSPRRLPGDTRTVCEVVAQ
ncbi:MAG TPA: GAF domain-containing protein, partial [Gemmata sp.]